jgi:ABC-2 type transport system permease protein
MNSTLRIARQEMRSAWRDRRFLGAAAVVLLLTAVALLTGAGRYRDIRLQQQAAAGETYAQWLAQPAKNPHTATHYGMYAFRPIFVTSLFDHGVDSYAGVAAFLEPHRQNDFAFRPAQDAGGASRFGDLSVAMILQVLVPLLIIILSFGAVAGEREAGTLRQLLSTGVAARTIAFGKLLGIAATLALALAPAVVAGGVALWMAAEAGDFVSSAPRLAGLAAAYGLYLAAWLVCSIAVSASARTPRLALVVLLACWGMATLIVPRAAVDVARAWHPTPTRVDFERQVARDLAALPDVAAQAERQALAAYGVRTIDELPVSFVGYEMMVAEANTTALYERRVSEVAGAFERQNEVQRMFGVLDPALAVRSASMALAGTDYAHVRHFANAAEQYRQLFVTLMNDDWTRNARGKDFAYVGSVDLWATVPPFEYAPPAGAEVVRQQASSLAALGAWVVLGVIGLVAATRRLAPT